MRKLVNLLYTIAIATMPLVYFACSEEDEPTDPTDATTSTDPTTPGDTAIVIDAGTIKDADIVGNKHYKLEAANTYTMDGLVYVESGSILEIEEGTVVKFKSTPSGSDPTSALFITKGAKIMAKGTPTAPIIFTAELDDLTGTTLTKEDNGQWGGLIILGDAPAEKKGVTEGIQIEGIASTETRGAYGGNNPTDNSGILKYISIRYTGIGFAANDELQGLTLGGVGSGTVIDYVDIFSTADDGVEIFGGTVDIKHMAISFATDDAFDLDLGWRGTGQFLFCLQRSDEDGYDHAGEWDGASPDDATLYTAPNIYNATFVGPGTAATGRDKALLMRENFAGKLGNSIIEDFPGKGFEVQDLSSGTVDSYEKMIEDELELLSNTFSNFGGATALDSLVKITSKNGKDVAQTPDDITGAAQIAELTNNDNKYSATGILAGVSRTAGSKGLDPRPIIEDSDVTTVPAGLEQVNYRGAFAASGATWLSGWSTLSKFGFLID